jgi:hypothetical protein
MDIQNDYDELSYIRFNKISFPPPPPSLFPDREDLRSVAIIFPEERTIMEEDNEDEIELKSQDSPRSSESGSAGSLVNFIVDGGCF